MDDTAALRRLEQQAEDAYARMYDAPNSTAAAGCYSDVKGFLADAIGLARRLEQTETVDRLNARLDHIRKVYRSQFS